MLLFNLLSNPILAVIFIIVLSLALSVHESAHAYLAYKFGDATAKNQGRVSLNPLRHFDPYGSLFLLLFGFGWGKPVPVDANNFSRPKLHRFFVAIAGPISNILFAIIIALIIKFLPINPAFISIFIFAIELNIALAIFNLLPIPPLDGSSILDLLLPMEILQVVEQLKLPLIAAFLIFIFSTNYISMLISWVSGFLLNILL